MLKDYMLEISTAFVPAEAPAPTENLGDAEAMARQAAAAKLSGSKPCVLPLSGAGTDVSQVLHVVHPMEVHAAVVTDLRATGGIAPTEASHQASEPSVERPKGST